MKRMIVIAPLQFLAFLASSVVCVACAGCAHGAAGDRAEVPRLLKNPADLRHLELLLLDVQYDGFSLKGIALLHATSRVELLPILNFKTLQVRSLSCCDGPSIYLEGPDFSAGNLNPPTIVLEKHDYYGRRFSESLFSRNESSRGGPACVASYTPTGDFLSPDVLNYDGRAFKVGARAEKSSEKATAGGE